MQYIWWRDFLDQEMVSEVQSCALDNEHKFVPTRVSTGDENYRRSMVLWHYEFIPLYNKFTDRIRQFLPMLQGDLGLYFDPGVFELQLTTSGDGEYFKLHTDNGSPDTATRQLTFVYYFLLSDHKKFVGGDLTLRLIDREVRIPPHHNSIIFFPSNLWHEVNPVSVPSKSFVHSRATLNGWVRSK